MGGGVLRAANSRPYVNTGENAPPIVGADRDEIGSGAGIIVFRQTDRFSIGIVHSLHLRYPVGGFMNRPVWTVNACSKTAVPASHHSEGMSCVNLHFG